MPLSFSDSPNPLSSGLPEWYLESRKSAWDNFLDTPFPQRKDENWTKHYRKDGDVREHKKKVTFRATLRELKSSLISSLLAS